MKILDIHPFRDGLRRNIVMLDRLGNEMESIHKSIECLVAMEDVLKGEGGNAIRAFYADCHLPFHQFFTMFQGRFVAVLKQMVSALDTLEPDPSGFIQQHYLEIDIAQGLRHIAQLTGSQTYEANSIMNQVADIVSLPHLDDSEVQYGIRDATIKRDDTVTQLYEVDATQTTALTPVAQDLLAMETWISDIESMFQEGLTDVHFESNQWAAITLNSGLQTAIAQQATVVEGGLESSDQEHLIGQEITAGTFRTLESKRTETIERGLYGSYNLLKFHIYENGLIIKEYQLGTKKPIQYEVVTEVEEEFEDGGVRELDSYLEGTPLAFVDYLNPRGIIKNGLKKGIIPLITGNKPVKYKGDISGRKVSTVGEKSKGTGKEYKNYKDVEYTGTTKVNGEVRDISRWVFQRLDIDYMRIDPKTGITNLQLMKKGRAPIWKDGTTIELHHLIQREPGSMVELPGSMHKEYNKILHGLVENGGSFRNDPVLKKQYENFRSKYWRWRAKQIDKVEL